jgi:5-methylthioadenosine/S-adenosylhomocysteine deaminase
MTSDRLDTLITNGTVITMNPSRDVLDEGYVAIRDSVIVAVGSGTPPPELEADETLDAGGGVVTPGLIDGHAHTAWGLAHCIVPLQYSAGESHRLCEAPLSAEITDEDEALGTLLTCAEMALNGTTCFADTGSAMRRLDAVADSVTEVGIRGMISFFNTDSGGELSAVESGTEECLARIEHGLQLYPPDGQRVWSCVGLLGVDHSTDALVREGKALATAYGAQLNVHKSSRLDEVQTTRERLGGMDPLIGFAKLGVLDPTTTLVHVNVCTDDEMAVLLESGTVVVHCPGASRFYGLGIASTMNRFPELVERGGVVALGTDSTIFPNSWDLLRQAYLTAALHRDGTGRPLLLAGDVLEMATLGGAAGVGRSDDLGSLEPGKRADVVIHAATRPEVHPLINVVDALVFSTGARSVRTVLVDGELVVSDGVLTRVNLGELNAEVDRAAANLMARAGLAGERTWPTGRSTSARPR